MRYLLGQMSKDERQAFEDAYFADDAVYAEILAAEDEIVHAWINGTMSPAERNHFEEHYLAAPTHRIRVRLEEALEQKQVAERKLDRSPESWQRLAVRWWIPLIAGAAIAFVAIMLRSGPGKAVPHTAQRRNSPQQPSGEAPGVSVPQATLAFTLTPGGLRGPGSSNEVLKIPAGAVTINFDAVLESPTTRPLKVSIETVSGRNVWTGDGLVQRRSSAPWAVRFQVPATLMTAGDYILTIRSANRTVEEYSLSVRRD